MKLKIGCLYYLKDEFYDQFMDENQLLKNKGLKQKRPVYLVAKNDKILWFFTP